MIESFVVSASSYAPDIDSLFTLIFLFVGVWFVLAEGVIFYSIFKFRRSVAPSARYLSGDPAEEKRWISWPHYLVIVCDIVLIAGTMKVWADVKVDQPPAEQKIRIISQQWAWTFVQPGLDGQIDTADDIRTVDELHVKTDTVYHFDLQSRDVMHSFSVPVFRLKQDAIPGRNIVGWFKPTRAGTYDIQCAEMCGIGHGIMGARIFIETAEEHQRWLQQPK